jgi:hypothetical protein
MPILQAYLRTSMSNRFRFFEGRKLWPICNVMNEIGSCLKPLCFFLHTYIHTSSVMI